MSNTSGSMRDSIRDTVRDAKDAVRESGKAAAEASTDVQADLEALRTDVTRLAGQIADMFTAKGGAAWTRARSNIEGVMSDATTRGQDAVDAVRGVGDEVIEMVDESLRKRPYTTLAMAVGVGFLLGALARR